MNDSRSLTVEVAYASPDEQMLVEIAVPAPATVGDAIAAAFEKTGGTAPDVGLPVGIWGRVVSRSAALQDGDRVEIYRPLKLDPREARRRYASAGLTMATGPGVSTEAGVKDPDSGSDP